VLQKLTYIPPLENESRQGRATIGKQKSTPLNKLIGMQRTLGDDLIGKLSGFEDDQHIVMHGSKGHRSE